MAGKRGESAGDPAAPSRARRLGWLLLIWCASVAALGLVALLIRGLMLAAGMRPA